MIQLILGVGLIGSAIWIANELQQKSIEERERWLAKRDDVERSIEWHQAKVEQHLDQARSSYDFKQLVDMHYSCVKVANQAYALLNDARISLKAIGQAIQNTKRQREQLFDQKNNLHDRSARKELEQEIFSIQTLRSKLFDDQNEIKRQRDELSLKVKDLNHKTRDLKIRIKERTGTQGEQWYARLEARKANRR